MKKTMSRKEQLADLVKRNKEQCRLDKQLEAKKVYPLQCCKCKKIYGTIETEHSSGLCEECKLKSFSPIALQKYINDTFLKEGSTRRIDAILETIKREVN